MNDTLFTLADAALKYKISIYTLQYYVHSGRLKTVRIGRRHFVTEADLFNIKPIDKGAANNE